MIIANILGILIFLFIFWKRLKEDYIPEKIFNAAFLILFGVALGTIVSRFFPIYWFWTIFIGLVLGFVVSSLIVKLRVYEASEGVVVGLISWFGLITLAHSVTTANLLSFLIFWFCLMLVFLFFFLDAHYRRFTWYKSGRVGFSGLSVFSIFFLVRSIIALFYPSVLSFCGRFESIISGLFAFIGFIFIFNLARQK